MPTPDVEPRNSDPLVEEAEDSREGWLSVALTDFDGGAAAVATAARGGLMPRREEPQE